MHLTEWVAADRIDLNQEVEWPAPEKHEKKKTTVTTKAPPSKAASSKTITTTKTGRARTDSRAGSATPDLLGAKAGNDQKRPSPSKAGGKENREEGFAPDGDASLMTTREGTPLPILGEESTQGDLDMPDITKTEEKVAPIMEPEEEIEKLRTGGSMVQNHTQLHLVRNLEKIQMGKHIIEPWYFSPYPQDFSDVDLVYVGRILFVVLLVQEGL